eukprot:4972225-Prymnesium_polylepis.1
MPQEVREERANLSIAAVVRASQLVSKIRLKLARRPDKVVTTLQAGAIVGETSLISNDRARHPPNHAHAPRRTRAAPAERCACVDRAQRD